MPSQSSAERGVLLLERPVPVAPAPVAESLECPLVERFPDPLLATYDFGRAARRRDAARVTMGRFVGELRRLLGT